VRRASGGTSPSEGHGVTRDDGPSRESVFREIVEIYAVALEYPNEVFTPDVELEAELGIDSVKQTELLGRLSEQYALPPRPADFRLSDYNTLGKVAEFVFNAMRTGMSTGAVR
jgi:acyl carrier protein